MADDDELEVPALYADQDEATVWARRIAWANEGLTPDQVDDWTDVREGSFFYVASVGGAREDARIYDLMGTEVPAAASPLFAWEGLLDALAEAQALERDAAVAAEGEVTFTGADGVQIAAGTVVSTEPPEPDAEVSEYETTEAGVLAGGTLTLAVRAALPGAAGSVSAGAVTAIVSPVDDPTGTLTVANATAISGGRDTETDEELRTKLLARLGGGGGGWNQEDYVIAALAYGQGIGRVTVIPAWNGPGTVKVIVATADGDPVAASTVTGLQALLDPIPGQSAGEVMVGATVTVQTTATLDVTLAGLVVELDAGYSIEGDSTTTGVRGPITERIQPYVESIESGGEIVIHRLYGIITSVRGVHDAKGLTINGTAANLAVPAAPTPRSPALVTPIGMAAGPVP